jgi:hypothetical protein
MKDWANVLNELFQDLTEHRGDNNCVPSYLIFYSIGSVSYFGYNLIENHVYSCGRINFCDHLSPQDQTKIRAMIKKLMKQTFNHEIKTVDLKK